MICTRRIRNSVLALMLALAVVSCSNRAVGGLTAGNCLEYTSFLNMTDSAGTVTASVLNPWKNGTVMHSYILGDGVTDYSFSGSVSYVHVPLERVVVMSNCHARLISELGFADRIKGVCEPEYISDSLVTAMCADGRIVNCGDAMYPNIETIINLRPDAILVSPFEDSGYGQLEKLGVPLIECADYMETSPLGRAEWMRFYGRLFGLEGAIAADSLFNKVSADYCSLAAMEFSGHPSVMLDTKQGSAWYVAGGGSTVGCVLADAGTRYIFADIENSGSVPLSFESVFARASDSDIWLLKNSTAGTISYNLLEQDYAPYARFKPFKTRSIWVCNVYRVPYFELTAFHPEMLLNDFIAIAHPESALTPIFYTPL